MKRIGVFMPGRLKSERLPNKLILPLGESNLWDIACKKLNDLPEKYDKYVLVNDSELIDIAMKYENIRIVLRGKGTTEVDGPLNFVFGDVKEMKSDYLMFLNPCLSLLSKETIVRSLEKFEESNCPFATSVKPYKNWIWGGDGGGGCKALIAPDPITLNTKIIPTHYEAAHCFHIFDKNIFLSIGTMLSECPTLLEVPKDETMDVDTEEDYIYAKFRLAKRYVFDLDNTLCITNGAGYINYVKATPIEERIKKVNELYARGNYIIIDTGRGSLSGVDCYELTRNQLDAWGLKYHELHVGKKIASDFYIDDKAINSGDFKW